MTPRKGRNESNKRKERDSRKERKNQRSSSPNLIAGGVFGDCSFSVRLLRLVCLGYLGYCAAKFPDHGKLFWFSWDVLCPHFFALGTPCGFILALLEPLGVPFCPKLAQDGEKTQFCLSLRPTSRMPDGTRNRRISTSKTIFCQDAFLTSMFIDFSSILVSKFRYFLA